jgi:hypothetical protein
MDFAGVIIIPLASAVSALVVILMNFRKESRHVFLFSFTLSLTLSVLLLILSDTTREYEWTLILASVALIALWALAGSVIGMAVGILIVTLVRGLLSSFRRRR